MPTGRVTTIVVGVKDDGGGEQYRQRAREDKEESAPPPRINVLIEREFVQTDEFIIDHLFP